MSAYDIFCGIVLLAAICAFLGLGISTYCEEKGIRMRCLRVRIVVTFDLAGKATCRDATFSYPRRIQDVKSYDEFYDDLSRIGGSR